MNINLQNFNNKVSTLPDSAQNYLRTTGTQSALSTRLGYAIDLNDFFDWLIENSPNFCDLKKESIITENIKKINSEDISNYISFQSDRGLKERTVARKRSALSSYFTYLVNNRYIPYNPVAAAARVKIKKTDEVLYMNMDEQNIFYNTVDNGIGLPDGAAKSHNKYKVRDKALIMLMLDTGMRVSEINSININMLDLEECSVIVERKGHKIQKIYFSEDVKTLIEEYLIERNITGSLLNNKNPLFITTSGNRLSIRAIQILVKKYSTSALPGKGLSITPHKLRSSFAMEFYGVGHDLLALQRKLGHENIVTTNVYAKATDQTMRETKEWRKKVKK